MNDSSNNSQPKDPAKRDHEQYEYLWEHFKFNATQRLQAFNFFVVFSVFADGGVFSASEKKLDDVWFILIGIFIAVLSLVFGLIDLRSQRLLKLAVPGLKEYEETFPSPTRIFRIDQERENGLIRYTTAFRLLFILQFIFGTGVFLMGLGKYFKFLCA